MQSTMRNTFANNLLNTTNFAAFIFEADRARNQGEKMNVQNAIDRADANGINSERTPKPPSNIMAEFEEVIIKN